MRNLERLEEIIKSYHRELEQLQFVIRVLEELNRIAKTVAERDPELANKIVDVAMEINEKFMITQLLVYMKFAEKIQKATGKSIKEIAEAYGIDTHSRSIYLELLAEEPTKETKENAK